MKRMDSSVVKALKNMNIKTSLYSNGNLKSFVYWIYFTDPLFEDFLSGFVCR